MTWRGGITILDLGPNQDVWRGGDDLFQQARTNATTIREVRADGYLITAAVELAADGVVFVPPTIVTCDAYVSAMNTRIYPRLNRAEPDIPTGRTPRVP